MTRFPLSSILIKFACVSFLFTSMIVTDRCTHCQRDLNPDLEAAQYSEASLDAKGKGVVLFEDQDRSSVEAELKEAEAVVDDEERTQQVGFPALLLMEH